MNLLENLSFLIEQAADINYRTPAWSRDEENRLCHNDYEANRIVIKEARDFVETIKSLLEAREWEKAHDEMDIEYERIKNNIEEIL